jgi:hypothetical protein
MIKNTEPQLLESQVLCRKVSPLFLYDSYGTRSAIKASIGLCPA